LLYIIAGLFFWFFFGEAKKNVKHLQISKRITPCIKDVSLNIHPESDEQIDDYRRAHRQKGYIYKIFPDRRGGYSHFLTDGRANTKDMPFNKMLQAIHN
jgi:hypothetical protein